MLRPRVLENGPAGAIQVLIFPAGHGGAHCQAWTGLAPRLAGCRIGQYLCTVNSHYKHTVGMGGNMLITNVCLYRVEIIYMTKMDK